MVLEAPGGETLVSCRTNGVPDDMDSSVDDYAVVGSVDEYTAGSATGDNVHQCATAVMLRV